MNKRVLTGLVVVFSLLAAFLAAEPWIPSVQGAAQGIVCTVKSSTNCPTNPLGVSTLAGATSVVVNVAVQNSPSLAGFEIIVKTNNSIISPTTVSVTGSVVPGASNGILGECINNSGNACTTLDGPGIVHLVVQGSGSTVAPTTGLLFSITYSITVNTPSTGAPIVFQTGCAISSNGNSCVNILTISA